MNENGQKKKLDELDKQRKNKKYFRLVGVAVLIIAAFLIGTLLNNSKKEVIVPGVQPPKEQQINDKNKQTTRTPERVINEYYTALKNGDYEKAAGYISQNAKRIDKRFANNAADQLHKWDLNEQPIVDFVIGDIKDEYDNNHKVVSLDVKRQGFSSAKGESSILELENGEWKVNPTGMVESVTLNQDLFHNNDLKINQIDTDVFPDRTEVSLYLDNIVNDAIFLPIKPELGKTYGSEYVLTTDQGSYAEYSVFNFTSAYGDYVRPSSSSNIIKLWFENAKGSPKTLKLTNLYYFEKNKKNESNQIIEINLSSKK